MGVYQIDKSYPGEKWYEDNQRRRKRIRRMWKKGYSPEEITKETGYDLGYVRRVIFGYSR